MVLLALRGAGATIVSGVEQCAGNVQGCGAQMVVGVVRRSDASALFGDEGRGSARERRIGFPLNRQA